MGDESSNPGGPRLQADDRLRDLLLRRFFRHHGYVPNLSSPNTLTEKVLHRMLFDRRPILATFADKLAVRGYVERRLAGKEHLSTIYGVFARADDLYSFGFPSRFALKANHGSGWNYIHHGGPCNRVRLAQLSRRWLNANYGRFKGEWAYNDIQPKVFCEEHLGTGDHVPVDYKFFCYSGTARFIQADFDRLSSHKRDVYDCDWNRFDVQYHYPPQPDPQHARQNLDRMISIAERLSEGIDFVRVDLYDLGDRVIFGELTNYPGGLTARFDPPEWDARFGSYWRLPAA